MYLPKGWFAAIGNAIETLSREDPVWGVLGVWGAKASGCRAGFVYCTATGRQLGKAFTGAEEVRSLDEVVLILRKSSGLRFDERLPGFHMYGTDICLEAGRQGMKNYAISAFCIHNSNAYKLLPAQFWRCYLFIRKKWKLALPIATPCIEITYSPWPMIRWNISQALSILSGRYKSRKRVDDPARLYQEIVSSGKVHAI
jgi:hypothetical protein